MVLRLKSIVFFLLIIKVAATKGQELYFQSMASKLNLPSDECYNVIQDKRGYIWIATDNGLCRYNGKTVRIYNRKNGLPEKGVYYIKEYEPGTLYLITSAGRILQIVQDSIREFPFTQAFIKYKKANNDAQVIYQLNRLKNKDLIISGYAFSYKISASGKVSLLKDGVNLERPAHEQMDLKNPEPFLIKLKNNSTAAVTQKSTRDLDFVLEDTVINLKYLAKNGHVDGERVLICQTKDFVFMSRGSKLIRLNKNDYTLSTYTLPNPILHLSVHTDGLWIGLRKSGLRYYPQPGDMQTARVGLEGNSVSGICIDREGSVWCTTLEKNVFYCNNKAILHYPKIKELNSRTSFMMGFGDTLIASTKFDELLIFYKNKLKTVKVEKVRSAELTGALNYKGHWYIGSKGYFSVMDKSFSRSALITHPKNKTTVGILQVDTFAGELYAMSGYALYKIFGHPFECYASEHMNLNSKGKSLAYVNADKIYVGCMDGIYKITLSDKSSVKLRGLSSEITLLKKISSGEILAGTKEEGLWLLKNDELKNIRIDNKQYSGIIFDIEQDKNGFIWLATNSGLVRLSKIAEGSYKSKIYNTSHGLLSNNIYDLAITRDLLYCSTKDGVCSFPKNTDLSNRVPPDIRINSLKVNGIPHTKNSEYLDLPYTKNSIEIGFDLLSFKTEENADVLLYKLIGSGDSLKASSSNLLSFNNLSPANYELVVYAINNDGVRSPQPVYFKFTIQPPFWKRPWFVLILLCLIILCISLLVKLVVKNIRKKEKETTRIHKLIAESQLSALQAQMNPHFIFNAINSIQNYILKQEKQKAFDYLGTFSRLIRMVLTHSRQTSVSLFQELELLKLYVELEQLRFKNAFSFNLKIAPDIDLTAIEIPAMLIQPYIENAIWHGLMSLGAQRKGQIILSFSRTDTLLLIGIEDNGIGREQANKYKNTSITSSLAMQLTGKRIEMINELRGGEGLKVNITDLKDSEGNPCGTKVDLSLVLEPDNFFYA